MLVYLYKKAIDFRPVNQGVYCLFFFNLVNPTDFSIPSFPVDLQQSRFQCKEATALPINFH